MALVALACALFVPAAARAELFVVDSTLDGADAVLGNEICLTEGNECTLRAAIEEANSSLFEFDEIVFEEEVFDGQVGGTINLGSSLPTMVAPAFVNGRICPTAAGADGPCVGIDGPSGAPALIVEGAEGVEIAGIAVTGAQTGIRVENAERFKAQASWFGVGLDGGVDGNTVGIFLGPGSPAGRIGGEGPEAGNVFANNAAEGLHIHGASNAKVLGNDFGVEPDGDTPAANGEDIEVTSVSGGLEAVGTAIGTRVSSAAAASAACDGGCNVISGAASNGVDLQGDGGAEAPAATTTVAGNYIGLNATGTAAVPNASLGIRVGEAAQTVIGGPKAGDANRINGGSIGVSAGPAAGDLVVRGNLIGVDAAGAEGLAPPGEAIVVNSEGLSSSAVEATIVANEISAEGIAISQRGFGAWIVGNEVIGAETGIRVFGSTEHGNLIEGNSVEGLEVNGILIENNLNEALGNEVSGSAGAGIRILGSPPFGVKENLIGGDAADEENVITGSGGAAIEIKNVKKPMNEIARNRGVANGGLFIDLAAALPGTELEGPNGGIEPPEFLTAAQTSASGSAEVGANVRVFRKQTADTGEIDSFLGKAIADDEGSWEVVYDAAIPGGTIVAATQTSAAGGTSELATATTAGESVGEESGGGGGTDSGKKAADEKVPQTKILKAPKKKSQSSTARFRFGSDEPGSSFRCKLDGKPFRACKSPKTYQDLKPGKHVFKVRAIDPAGNADPSPAKKKFTVLEP